jgi:palmitoyltransferase ZDHHC9/14/18
VADISGLNTLPHYQLRLHISHCYVFRHSSKHQLLTQGYPPHTNLTQILPRNIHVLPSEPTEAWHLLPAPREVPIVSKHTYLDSPRYVTTKYCTTCRLWRPPRSSHCRVCDSCVEYCDHHCIWLNNCVGRRNYRYFFTFILSTAMMGLYLTGQSIWYIIFVCHRDNRSLSQAVRGVGPGVSLALACYGILGAFYPLALVSYHFYLVMTGQNTHEYVSPSPRWLMVVAEQIFDV